MEYCKETYRNWSNHFLYHLCEQFDYLNPDAQKALKTILVERNITIPDTIAKNPNWPSRTGNISGKNRGNSLVPQKC